MSNKFVMALIAATIAILFALSTMMAIATLIMLITQGNIPQWS